MCTFYFFLQCDLMDANNREDDLTVNNNMGYALSNQNYDYRYYKPYDFEAYPVRSYPYPGYGVPYPLYGFPYTRRGDELSSQSKLLNDDNNLNVNGENRLSFNNQYGLNNWNSK